MAKPNPVVVVGAGPVGLCLALALAQQDVSVVLVEAMSDDNFLDQVPRAGSNHPTTLEFFDRIGLYAKMEPRGLIAPKFQYWDRQDNALIAEFDHALLKDDTRFPYVLQCERIKIIEEALKMAKAHPLVEVRMATEFTGFEQTGDTVLVETTNAAGEAETIRASYLVSGIIAKATGGWRPALFVAALPGFLLGVLALFLPEPARGASDPGLAASRSSQRTAIKITSADSRRRRTEKVPATSSGRPRRVAPSWRHKCSGNVCGVGS